MRERSQCFLAGMLGLMVSTAAQAGLYNPAEPAVGPAASAPAIKPLPFSQLRDLVLTTLQFGIESPASPARQQYLTLKETLERKARRGSLTVDERIQLSAILIRLRQPEEAVQLLTPTATQERRNFMVLANLAMAHQRAGRLDRALSYLEQVQDVWPTSWPGLSPEQLQWFHEAEKYHLRLVRLRYRESLQARAGAARPSEKLDDLFGKDSGPVQFIGESGQFEPGKLASREQAKLPPRALALVQQLVLWLPEDTRLYWFLGELYNAEGDLEAAAKIFEDCVWSRRYDAPELKAHRQLVQEAAPRSAPLALESEPVLAQEAEPAPSWLPDKRKLSIAGIFVAAVVLLFGYLQIREFRRRWQTRA